MNDFEKKLNVKTLAGQLLYIAVAKNNMVEQIQEIAYREVDGTPSCQSSLRFCLIKLIPIFKQPIRPCFAATQL